MKKMITTISLILILMTRLTAPATSYCYIEAGEVYSTALTWENIEREINKLGILEPDKVMLQIRLETGNLTSRLCLDDNNLIGMHYPRKRPTTATGKVKKNGMAHYYCWQDCLKDYKIWQDYFYKGGDYWLFLNKRYATDVYYVIKLKRLK